MGNPYPAEVIDANDQVRAGLEINFTDPDNQPGLSGLSGDGSPTGVVTPDGIGQLYVDTTNGGLYIATTLANDDWIIVGGQRDPSDNTTQGVGVVTD